MRVFTWLRFPIGSALISYLYLFFITIKLVINYLIQVLNKKKLLFTLFLITIFNYFFWKKSCMGKMLHP